ncbi:MAG: MarR family winged helix-turn-helix transcriptional regulator [Solirubrobacteraceae bacterium]
MPASNLLRMMQTALARFEEQAPSEPLAQELAKARDAEEAAQSANADLPARLRVAIGRLSRRLRNTAASSGLTPSEISVLFTVVRRGPLRLAEIAEIEAINPTMLSRIASRLTALDLIHRGADPSDRRAALVEATDAGRRMRGRIHRERTEAIEAHLVALSAEELRTLAAALPLLERLAESLGESRT